MNRIRTVVVALGVFVAGTLTGCETNGSKYTGGFERPGQVGWLGAVSSFENNALIAEDQLLTTIYKKGFLGIGWDLKYEVLVGADPLNPDVKAKSYLKKMDAHFVLFVETGFAYMDGNHPYGSAGGGSTSSEGSVMLIQGGLTSETGKPMARFYFLEGDSMTVVGSTTKKTETVGQYIAVVDGVPSEPADIPGDPEDPIRKFVDAVLELATEAGFNVPIW